MTITALTDGRPALQQRRIPQAVTPRDPTLFDDLASAADHGGRPREPGTARRSSHQFASALTQVVLEALQGQRTTRQLVRWIDDRSLLELNHQIALRRGQHVAVSCGSLRVQLHEEVAELAVRFLDRGQSFALAAKIEQVQGRWVCTCLDFGPPIGLSRPVTDHLSGARGTA